MVYACICLCWGSTIRGNDHCLPRGTTMFWASLPSRNKPLVGGALDLRISGISMYPELRGPPGLTGRSPWLFSLLCATPPSAWLLLPLNVSAKVVQAQMKCRALLRREHSHHGPSPRGSYILAPTLWRLLCCLGTWSFTIHTSFHQMSVWLQNLNSQPVRCTTSVRPSILPQPLPLQ